MGRAIAPDALPGVRRGQRACVHPSCPRPCGLNLGALGSVRIPPMGGSPQCSLGLLLADEPDRLPAIIIHTWHALPAAAASFGLRAVHWIDRVGAPDQAGTFGEIAVVLAVPAGRPVGRIERCHAAMMHLQWLARRTRFQTSAKSSAASQPPFGSTLSVRALPPLASSSTSIASVASFGRIPRLYTTMRSNVSATSWRACMRAV